jgi:hypothetical protein
MLGARKFVCDRLLNLGGDRNSFLLLCPNLTMVALGASVLLELPGAEGLATWLLLTGLFITIPAILFLPPSEGIQPVLSPHVGENIMLAKSLPDPKAAPPQVVAGPMASAVPE